jgi:hypothetical protein
VIITDRFVYIHMPKTGGTFVTEMLRHLYGLRGSPNPWRRTYWKLTIKNYTSLNKHGTCSQIPREYGHLPIVGCVRNPFDRYVSTYAFEWWRMYPEQYPGLLEHPNYPDLNFEEYVRLANEKWLDRENPGVQVDSTLGWQTAQFVSWYCNEPAEVLRSVAGRSPTVEDVQRSLSPERFLNTHRLNQELHDYLRDKGFEEARLSFILESPKILPPGVGRRDNWEKYYTPELKAFVEQRERILFDLFPEFRV